jgi:hypothetical protein
MIFTSAFAQSKLELTPQGFLPLEIKTPNQTNDKLLQVSKSWATYYNKKGEDVFDVTENSLTIEARVENAFYYYNFGVKHNHDVVYKLKVVFEENKKYKLSISVKEIYAENQLLKTTTANFFSTDGKLKDDFKDAKLSLENTVNRIANSYIKFIAQ